LFLGGGVDDDTDDGTSVTLGVRGHCQEESKENGDGTLHESASS
jgi:hypothetical protein